MVEAKPERRYDLDWLKVITTLLVFCFHVARVFNTEDWSVKNDYLLEREKPIYALIKSTQHSQPPLNTNGLPMATVQTLDHLPQHEQEVIQTLAATQDQILLAPSDVQNSLIYNTQTLQTVGVLAKVVQANGKNVRALLPDTSKAQNFADGSRVQSQSFKSYLSAQVLPRGEFLIVDGSAFGSGEQAQAFLERATGAANRVLVIGRPVFFPIELFVSFLNQWFMPLFFFISGTGTCFALKRRSASQYVRERFTRLFIPFLFGCLVVVPPQVYYELRSDPTYRSSYLQFYPSFFSHFTWAHLWFIIYLFVFSIVALPLFVYLKTPSGTKAVGLIADFCTRPGAIFLVGIPIGLIEAALRGRWGFGNYNLVDDWSDVCYYLAFFILGYLLSMEPRFGKALDQHWKLALGLAIALMTVMFTVSFLGFVPPQGYSLGYMGFIFVHGVRAWLWIVGILGFARSRLNFKMPFLTYASEAAYPFYILHQSVIIAVAFYIVRWSVGASGKFLAVFAIALTLTCILYELFVRRTNITRFLFGMKSLSNTASSKLSA
ncbi:MAG: acyltransferase family protein [Anaerolineae bacterium]|nr:acyltransferase family protein [Gloeobacterales cyanobacterium ES-bin-313]